MGQIARNLFCKLWRYFPFGCFVTAILCLCFAYGVAVGNWHLFPYSLLNEGFDSLRSLVNRQHPGYLHPARYKGEGVVVCERERVCPGVTLLTGHWKDGDNWNLGIRLIDLNGNVLHHWRINPYDIWVQSPHSDGMKITCRKFWKALDMVENMQILPVN